MLTKACVLDDLEIVPNCRGSILCGQFFVVFSEFGQDRREGKGTQVLVNIINGPLFWNWDYISLFQRGRKAGFVERMVCSYGMVSSFNFAFRNGTLAISHRQGIISLIPKKKKNTEYFSKKLATHIFT